MFTINQAPYRPAGLGAVDLQVFVQGSMITINDEPFDFSFMEKGSTLPRAAVDSPHFASDVVCDDAGVIILTLLVPIGPTPTEAEAFPPALEGKKYGKVIDIHLPAVELPAPAPAPAPDAEVANG
ncbi:MULTISPECIES: hypothetical protein [unclassified Pseudomonas]|uniref:hypothetical protein n=1 Tax=unclassified Pseudomonas TaxID=196821 RepID=UPI00131B9AC2|nr:MULTISPECIES: hypothetical protein [unclassified Pseudomonas]